MFVGTYIMAHLKSLREGWTIPLSWTFPNFTDTVIKQQRSYSHIQKVLCNQHSFNSRIYPQFFDIYDSALDNYIDKLASPYIVENIYLRKTSAGRHDLNSKALSAFSVATGHSQVSTTFSHYIHTSDHHLYHVSSVPEIWNGTESANILTHYSLILLSYISLIVSFHQFHM